MPKLEIAPSEAIKLFHQAGAKNPGPWTAHSIFTAFAAKRIAEADGSMNPDQAFVLGLLHDIGRIKGPTDLRHVTDGYKFLMSLGCPECAGICLSHSFPDKCLGTYFGKPDVEPNDLSFLQEYLKDCAFTDYDLLIQLCDFIAHGSGFCIVEKRMVDTVLRHSVKEVPFDKWKAVFNIMEFFNKRIGKTVYSLLPGIAYGTFGSDDLQTESDKDLDSMIMSLGKLAVYND